MDRHYEIDSHDKATGLWRIRALRDLPRGGVHKGMLGGLIEDLENLQEDAWVYPEGTVRGEAVVSGNARISGTVLLGAEVSGDAQIGKDVRIGGRAQVKGYTTIIGNTQISGDTSVSGAAFIQGAGSGLALRGGVFSGGIYIKSEGIIRGGTFTEDTRIYGPFNYNPLNTRGSEGVPEISRPEHYLYLGRLGSERVNVTLHHAVDGVPWITVGCWDGPLTELMGEVNRRRNGYEWSGLTQLEAESLLEHYRGVKMICEGQVRLW